MPPDPALADEDELVGDGVDAAVDVVAGAAAVELLELPEEPQPLTASASPATTARDNA